MILGNGKPNFFLKNFKYLKHTYFHLPFMCQQPQQKSNALTPFERTASTSLGIGKFSPRAELDAGFAIENRTSGQKIRKRYQKWNLHIYWGLTHQPKATQLHNAKEGCFTVKGWAEDAQSHATTHRNLFKRPYAFGRRHKKAKTGFEGQCKWAHQA